MMELVLVFGVLPSLMIGWVAIVVVVALAYEGLLIAWVRMLDHGEREDE